MIKHYLRAIGYNIFWLICCLMLPFLPPLHISANILDPPSAQHWFGTDPLGQDVALRLFYALPNTLLIALMTGLIAVSLALILAYLVTQLSFIDGLMLKLIDTLMVLPTTLILILVSALWRPELWGCIILLALLLWIDSFRVLRSTVLREIERESILIARSYGAGNVYLLCYHLLPQLLPTLQGLFVQTARRGVMLSAGLAFLGLTDPRLPNWGNLLFEAQEYLYSNAFWQLMLPPTLALTLLMLTLNQLNFSRQKAGY